MVIRTVCLLATDDTAAFAAEELKHYYGLLTGQQLDVVSDPQVADLVIGNSSGLEPLPESIKGLVNCICDDGYVTGVLRDKAYLLADCSRGVLYAVYDLFKRNGVVFAAPGKEYVPEKSELVAEHSLQVVNPKMAYRGIGFHNGWTKCGTDFVAEIDWMVKVGLNWVQFFSDCYEKRRDGLVDAVAKRDVFLDVGAHSAFFFLPPAEYIETEPELYSRTASGEMIGKQLCYGNPATPARFAEACLAYLAKRPEIKILGLWPEDGGGDCECEHCHGKDRQKLVGDVVNYVAEKIKEQYPDVLINHLAYCQFIKPQADLVFSNNVLVNHCDYWSRTINRPIYDFRYGQSVLLPPDVKQDTEARGLFVRDHIDIRQELVEWKQCTSILTAFSYYSDLVMKQSLLTDVSDTIKADLNFYKAVGMKGFVDCCCYPEKSLAFAFNWYTLATYAWSNDKSREELLREFTKAYFGEEASENAVQVYNLLQQLMDDPSLLGYNVIDLYHRDSREVAWQCGIVDDLLEPESRRVSHMLEKMKHLAKASELGVLRQMVEDLELRFPIVFGLYVTWANIDRHQLEKARIAVAGVTDALQSYREWNSLNKAGYEQYIGSFERFIDTAQKAVEDE